MSWYKKCIYISSVFLIVGCAVLIFGLFLNGMILDQAAESAQMKEDTNDLWAYVPGKSKVNLYKDHYMYSVENLDGIFFGNEKAIVQEKGPYRIQEYDELIDRNYSLDNTTVSMKYWRYYHDVSDAEASKQNDTISLFNLVGLGVWYQAKNAKQSQVALKALYSIYQGLVNDFYYGAIQKAVMTIHTSTVKYLDKFANDSYFTPEFKMKLTFDKDYGLYSQNNAFFIKAVFTHPSPDSQFLMDYFNIAYHEVDYLKHLFIKDISTPFKGYTNKELATRQWLDLSIAKDTLQKENKTTPGYIEYGAFLRYKKDGIKSNLTYDKAFKLFFDFNDIGRKPQIDDSECLINKVNLDNIFELADADENSAIDYINTQLKINDTVESRHLYEYLNYVSGEMAFNRENGGTGGIGAMADFLSAGLFKVFNTMGWDLYFELLSHDAYIGYFSPIDNNTTCTAALGNLTSLDVVKICQNDKLNTDKYENIKTWVKGVLYKEPDFKKALVQSLQIDDNDYYELTKDTSKFVVKFNSYVQNIQAKFDISGNFKTINPINIAAVQWSTGNVTQTGDKYSAKSVKDWPSSASNYKKPPEYTEFCNLYNCTTAISYESFKNITNFDHLFSSKWISDALICYYNNNYTMKVDIPSEYYSKDFIRYLRYILTNEVFNLFTSRSVKDLLWGYEDDFLKMIKNDVSYFVGGDPTIDTKFTLLNNMTNKPDDDNIWSMYTGVGNKSLTRQYRTILGLNDSVIK